MLRLRELLVHSVDASKQNVSVSKVRRSNSAAAASRGRGSKAAAASPTRKLRPAQRPRGGTARTARTARTAQRRAAGARAVSVASSEARDAGTIGPSLERPRWLRDLLQFLPLRSQLVLSGNVRDLQIHETAPGQVTASSLMTLLAEQLRARGYERIVTYEPGSGLRVLAAPGPCPASGDELLSALGLMPSEGAAPCGIDMLSAVLPRFAALEGSPAALLIDYASRLIVRRDVLSLSEHSLFTRAQVVSCTACPRPPGRALQPCFNTILWIVDKEGDLPDWLLIGNPRVRHIPVAVPDHRARRRLAPILLERLSGGGGEDAARIAEACTIFVEQTEGLLLRDLADIVELARGEGLGLTQIAAAVRRYKLGVTEDPWRNVDREKIRSAEPFIRKRVKGQAHAVTHMLDVIKRAVTGIGQSPRAGRPRGVAFLAGPTGVGKTELAKTITSLLFGDERSYIRFDMSEFNAEHADQRLIGAPPGYIGHDMGGELTNAIRERPFSVLLFDEIEKAHPSILDKFLQILEDGVLTSGRGERVYFSESFLIFTSNLGIYAAGPEGSRVLAVPPGSPFEVVQSRVRAGIDHHFKSALNRPELLNRIGENVIVFDFIRGEVAGEIFDELVDTLLGDVRDLGFHVTIVPGARDTLKSLCLADLANGGRGIRNKVEAHLVSPLSRALFDAQAQPGSQHEITAVEAGVSSVITLRPAGPARASS